MAKHTASNPRAGTQRRSTPSTPALQGSTPSNKTLVQQRSDFTSEGAPVTPIPELPKPVQPIR